MTAAGCKRPLEGGSVAQGSLGQPEGAKRLAGRGFCGSGGSAAMDTLGTSGGSAETPFLAAATAAVVTDEDELPVTVVEAEGSVTFLSFPDLGTSNLMLQLGHWLLLSSGCLESGSAASCVGGGSVQEGAASAGDCGSRHGPSAGRDGGNDGNEHGCRNTDGGAGRRAREHRGQ